jgi:gluconokinase
MRGNGSPEGWFLGIDLGTGSCKSVVISENADILGHGAGDYAGADVGSIWNEQSPEAVLDGMIWSVRLAVKAAGVNPSHCLGIGMCGALHSVIGLNRLGEPLTGVLTWADGRATSQAQAIRKTAQAAELYQRTGCPVHGMYPLYKILWLREQKPEVYQQVSRYVTAKEYVFEKLTGERVVDYSLPSGSSLLNIHDLNWDPLALDLAGIRPDQLSTLADPLTTFHQMNPELAQALGLPVNTPVTLGSSDAASSNFGAGAVSPWQATCMIGTSGAFRVISPRPILDPVARLWCYAIDDARWLVGGAINNGGIAFSWLKDAINQLPKLQSDHPLLSFDDFILLAQEAFPGADGLICLPFFTSERSPNWNMNARAVFFGLTLQHDLRHLSRAILEGVAYRLRSISEILCQANANIREVRASGGFTHSQLWPQIITNVLGRQLLIPAWGETSSLGAAFWAMLAAGGLTAFDDAARLIKIADQYDPVPEDVGMYDRLYQIYVNLYQSLCPAFDQIAEFQQDLKAQPERD